VRAVVEPPARPASVVLEPSRGDARAPDAEVVAEGEASSPIEETSLVRGKLVRFGSLATACKGLLERSRSGSLVFMRPQRGSTFTVVRSGCRGRPFSRPPGEGEHRAKREPLLVELSRTTAVPRHGEADSFAVAPAFPVGDAAWLVAVDAAEESQGVQTLLRWANGSVAVTAFERVDLGATARPELVMVLAVLEQPHTRFDLVVCDEHGAWCTAPMMIDRLLGGDRHDWSPEDARYAPVTEARSYAFRPHPRGLVVVTTDASPVADRLFPMDPP